MNAMAGAGSRPRRCTPPRSPLADGPHLVEHPHGVGQHPDGAPLTLQGLDGALGHLRPELAGNHRTSTSRQELSRSPRAPSGPVQPPAAA